MKRASKAPKRKTLKAIHVAKVKAFKAKKRGKR